MGDTGGPPNPGQQPTKRVASPPTVATKRKKKNMQTRKRNATQRTLVHTRQILERRKQEHGDDAHAEDLHAAAGHVQHERLHGQRLYGRNREIPRLSRLEIFVRVHRRVFARARARARRHRRRRGGRGGRGGRRGFAGCFSL